MDEIAIENFTGIPMAVDHIAPLQGRMISGLHVASNLRIVTRLENARKSNAFRPEFPAPSLIQMVIA